MKTKEVVHKSAVISEDGKYRYRLDRWWGEGKRLVFLMMNPSTADADKDDATIRKCMGFARLWNYDGITVVNLFALRSRDPGELVTADDPVGEWPSSHVKEVLSETDTVVCAWGCESTLSKKNVPSVMTLGQIAAMVTGWWRSEFPAVRWMCLGHTKGGTPRHPLMLAYSTMAVEL